MNLAFLGFRHSHIFSLYDIAVQMPEIVIYKCIEGDAEARGAASKRLGREVSDGNINDLTCDDNVDAIAVGDYYGARGEIIKAALAAGKHVISDKPICTSRRQLSEIEAAAKSGNAVLGAMYDLRYLPITAHARETVLSGKLGKIHNVSFTGQHHLDYGSRPMWYFEQGKHGGTINDIAIHGIDLTRYITGQEFSDKCSARQWNAYADKQSHFNDCAIFMGQLTCGAGVLADVSYSAPRYGGALPTYWDFKFWGDYGMMALNLMDDSVTLYMQDCNTPQVFYGKERNPETDYVKDFLASIKGKKAILSMDEVLKSAATALYIQSRADTNCWQIP